MSLLDDIKSKKMFSGWCGNDSQDYKITASGREALKASPVSNNRIQANRLNSSGPTSV